MARQQSAPSAEHQHPEAQPASTYGHLREVLFGGALNEHWALSRLGDWVLMALSRQALSRSTVTMKGCSKLPFFW